MYEGLVRADADGKIVPVLATRWTVDAALTTDEFASFQRLLRAQARFACGSK